MAQKLDIQYVSYYTAGSAARKLTPVFPLGKPLLPKAKKRRARKIYIDPVAVVGTLVAVAMLVMMITGISQLRQAHSSNAQMRTYVTQLEQSNAALEQKFSESYDLFEVEQTALALGMIPREEVQHTTIRLEAPVMEEAAPVTLWEQIGTFLTGLFA